MYKNIPEELKEIDNWVCYNKDKRPVNPNTGYYAKPNDSETWGSYEEALYMGDMKQLGIGFMIGDTDYVGVDIDDLKENRNVAGEFMNKLDSYTEYSPSKNGIHIWVKGDIDINRYRKDGIEVYDKTSPRYLTFTGDAIGDVRHINDTTEELMELHDKYIGNTKKSNVVDLPSRPVDLNETELIEKIESSKQGKLFNELYSGNWEGRYNSQSEADLTLANILAFWTGRDYSKMDAIFRSSGLYREKWNEKRGDGTYGEIIIDKAINDTTDVYTPKSNYSIAIENKEVKSQTGSDLVIAIGKSYLKMTEGNPKPISTFIIELLEIIQNDLDNEMYFKCNFISKSYEQEVTFKAKEMNNKNNFMDLLQHPSFSFSGSLNDLQEIKKILAMQGYRNLRGVSYIGFHESKGKRVFVTQDEAIDKKFKPVKDITINDDNKIITTKILEHDPIKKEELQKLSKHLFQFNDLSITASLISMLPVFMMKPLLYKKDIKTQHLIMYGEAGSGKSQTAETLILPFYSLNSQEVLSCSNVTQFSLLKSLSNTNALPVILDEYKPSFMHESQVKMISDNLRNTYDCHVATRGTKNQKLINYPMLAPVVLIGEEGQEETAIKERSVIINFNKKAREGKEDSFLFLKDNPDLISKLGRSVLGNVLNLSEDKVIERRNKMMEKFIVKNITENRVKESVSNLVLGLSIITEIYKDLDLNFEEETDLEIVNIINCINKNIYVEVLDSSNSTKSVLDNTIEQFNNMASLYKLDYNHDFTIVNGNQIAFHMSSTYAKLTKYIREYNVNTEILTTQSQFTSQLTNTDYYVGYKNVRFDGKQKRAYVLDMEELEKKKIDIESLIAQKDRLK